MLVGHLLVSDKRQPGGPALSLLSREAMISRDRVIRRRPAEKRSGKKCGCTVSWRLTYFLA